MSGAPPGSPKAQVSEEERHVAQARAERRAEHLRDLRALLQILPSNRLPADVSDILDIYVQLLPKDNIVVKAPRPTQLAIMALVYTRTLEPGHVLFQQGDRGDAFYVLLAGQVDVWVRSKEVAADESESTMAKRQTTAGQDYGLMVAQLPTGASFGELALLDVGSVRNATVVADQQHGCELLVIDKAVYAEHLAAYDNVKVELDQKYAFLHSLPVFKQWHRSKLHRLAYCMEFRHVPFGGFIFRRGDPATALYVVYSGDVRVVRKELTQAEQLQRMRRDAENASKKKSKRGKGKRSGEVAEEPSTSDPAGAAAAAGAIEETRTILPHQQAMIDYREGRALSAVRHHAAVLSAGRYSPGGFRAANKVKEISMLGPGSFLGEAEILQRQKEFDSDVVSASAEAVVLVLAKQHFDRLVRGTSRRSIQMLENVSSARQGWQQRREGGADRRKRVGKVFAAGRPATDTTLQKYWAGRPGTASGSGSGAPLYSQEVNATAPVNMATPSMNVRPVSHRHLRATNGGSPDRPIRFGRARTRSGLPKSSELAAGRTDVITEKGLYVQRTPTLAELRRAATENGGRRRGVI